MGHWHQLYRPRLRWWWKPWTWRRRPVVVPGSLKSAETYYGRNIEPTSTTIDEVFRNLPDHLKP